MSKDKEQEQPERFIHPEEACSAAHHLKMAHHVKNDKQLHKAAKEHLSKEVEAVNGALGKKPASDKKAAAKKASPAAAKAKAKK